MSELFEDDSEDKDLVAQDDDLVEDEVPLDEGSKLPISPDARRRLENLLDEKRLRDELKDFLDD